MHSFNISGALAIFHTASFPSTITFCSSVALQNRPIGSGVGGAAFSCRKQTGTGTSVTVASGDSIDLTWSFTAAHVGDCAVYLSYDAGAVNAASATWFKIANLKTCEAQVSYHYYFRFYCMTEFTVLINRFSIIFIIYTERNPGERDDSERASGIGSRCASLGVVLSAAGTDHPGVLRQLC